MVYPRLSPDETSAFSRIDITLAGVFCSIKSAELEGALDGVCMSVAGAALVIPDSVECTATLTEDCGFELGKKIW